MVTGNRVIVDSSTLFTRRLECRCPFHTEPLSTSELGRGVAPPDDRGVDERLVSLQAQASLQFTNALTPWIAHQKGNPSNDVGESHALPFAEQEMGELFGHPEFNGFAHRMTPFPHIGESAHPSVLITANQPFWA